MMRPARRIATVVLLLGLALTVSVRSAGPQRIVSLIPATTEMIFAIGDGSRVVGVSNYDRQPPEVTRLTRVGGLLDPDMERILSLRPDLVVIYATQVELRQRLERAAIPYYSYEHRGLADITDTIRSLGERLGDPEPARIVASNIERALSTIRASVAGRPRPRTMLVFGRDPGSLRAIDASGGVGFLHDMLEAAGGENVFADVKTQAVRASTEIVLARRPDVIIELRYGDAGRTLDVTRELQAWRALGSVPAVRNNRIHILVGDEFVVPGPRVVAATERLARTLHPNTR